MKLKESSQDERIDWKNGGLGERIEEIGERSKERKEMREEIGERRRVTADGREERGDRNRDEK